MWCVRQRDVDVEASRSGRLRHAGYVEPIEFLLDPARDVAHAIEARAFAWIEIDGDIVRVQRIRDAGEPGVL
jgi:hypothetical protein